MLPSGTSPTRWDVCGSVDIGGKADVASCWPKTVFLTRPRNHFSHTDGLLCVALRRSTIVAPLNAERRGFGKRQSTAPVLLSAARLVSTSSIRTMSPNRRPAIEFPMGPDAIG
jgi:hypothetical protein